VYHIQDGDDPVPGYHTFWLNKRSTLKSEYPTLVQQYPDAFAQLKQLFKVLGDIEDVAEHTPASVWESAKWAAIVNAAEENGASYCKALDGKTLFSALYGTYGVTLHELRALLKASTLTCQTNSPKPQGNQKRSQSQSHFTTDGRSVSQSACLGVEPHLELMTRY
jgi:alanyl-tRNA synthetase